jgi:hypothetical protein
VVAVSLLLFGWGLGFLGSAGLGYALGGRSRERRVRGTPAWVVAGASITAGVVGVLSDVQPTTIGPVNLFFSFVFAAMVCAAAGKARRGLRFASSLIVAGAAAFVALGIAQTGGVGAAPLVIMLATAGAAGAAYLYPERAPIVGQFIGVGLAYGILRIPTGLPTGVPSVLAALSAGLVFISGLAGLSKVWRTRVSRGAIGFALLMFGCAMAGALALINARVAAERGIAEAQKGLTAASEGDAGNASTLFEGASVALLDARSELTGGLARVGEVVPIAAQHIEVLRELTGAAAKVTTSAGTATAAADLETLRVQGGAINLAQMAEIGQNLQTADDALQIARSALNDASSPWLLPQVTSRLKGLEEQLNEADNQANDARRILTNVPPMLGSDRPRRYLLVFPTPAEIRGSGGVFGNFGELTAIDGKLVLSRFGRIAEMYSTPGAVPLDQRAFIAPPEYLRRYSDWIIPYVWSNALVSPDFPTAAKVLADQYPQAGGQPLDGVISMTPLALQSLLGAIGPIEVPSWPAPITSANAGQILMNEAYIQKGGGTAERIGLLEEVSLKTWDTLINGATQPENARRFACTSG